jgi:hypothetical protein
MEEHPMIRRTILLAVMLLPALGYAQSMESLKGMVSKDTMKQAGDLLGGSMSGLLQQQLDLSPDQADGGIGSMLSLASEHLSGDEFEQLAGAIPGASGYLDKAKALGAVTGPLQNIAGLNNALSSLGIPAETVAKFVPTILDYLGKAGGGSDAAGLLTRALGM